MRTLAFRLALVLPLAAGCAVQSERESPAGESHLAASVATVPVYINHAFGMYSQATIDALQTNPYLRDTFVDVEVRTTVRPDITYTGTYLNTRVTYFESFVEGSLGLPRNVFQLALGTERTGGAEIVQQLWNEEFNETQTEIPFFYRRIDGVDVPWFRGVVPDWTNSTQSVALFDLEYVPNPGSSAPRTRLEERAARYDPTKLARDVQAFVFAAPTGEIDLFRRALAAVGWIVWPRAEGFLALSPVDHGTRRAVLAELSEPARAGLLGVVFRLNRFERHTEPLGDAVLKVGIAGGPFAVLWFVAPAPRAEADLAAVLLP